VLSYFRQMRVLCEGLAWKKLLTVDFTIVINIYKDSRLRVLELTGSA